LREIRSIESVLSESTKGWANATAKAAVERHLQAIAAACGEGHGIDGKVASIRNWLDVLFSARKHANYGGPDRVESHIRHDLASISGIAGRNDS
jgi:hypothetical protein